INQVITYLKKKQLRLSNSVVVNANAPQSHLSKRNLILSLVVGALVVTSIAFGSWILGPFVSGLFLSSRLGLLQRIVNYRMGLLEFGTIGAVSSIMTGAW